MGVIRDLALLYYARRAFERVSKPQHPCNALRRGGSFVELECPFAELIQNLACFDAKVLIWIASHCSASCSGGMRCLRTHDTQQRPRQAAEFHGSLQRLARADLSLFGGLRGAGNGDVDLLHGGGLLFGRELDLTRGLSRGAHQAGDLPESGG